MIFGIIYIVFTLVSMVAMIILATKAGELKAESRILKAFSAITKKLSEDLELIAEDEKAMSKMAMLQNACIREMADAVMFKDKAQYLGRQFKKGDMDDKPRVGTDFNQT